MKSRTHEDIAFEAFALWNSLGCPEGRDLEIWLEAERQFGNEDAASVRFSADEIDQTMPARPESSTQIMIITAAADDQLTRLERRRTNASSEREPEPAASSRRAS